MMAWKMTFCPDSFGPDPIVERDFEDMEHGMTWLEENAPDLLRPKVWKKLEGDWRQFGTNNRWVRFEYGPHEPCCSACRGTGGIYGGPCSDCYGTGCAHP